MNHGRCINMPLMPFYHNMGFTVLRFNFRGVGGPVRRIRSRASVNSPASVSAGLSAVDEQQLQALLGCGLSRFRRMDRPCNC